MAPTFHSPFVGFTINRVIVEQLSGHFIKLIFLQYVGHQ